MVDYGGVDMQNYQHNKERIDMMPRLENWHVTCDDPYNAPEMRTICIVGEVYGHPEQSLHYDGKRVMTSRVIGCHGRVVTTMSRDYLLGDPSDEYRNWLRENRPNWDEENPISVITTATDA